MGEFNSDDHYIYYCGRESLRRNGVAIMVNKRVRNAVLGCNLKNNRMGQTRDLFKKIRDTKGIFHAKMGSIKDRNRMDLTEAEILRRDSKNTQKNCTKMIVTTQIITMV